MTMPDTKAYGGLERLARAALLPMPEKHRRSYFNRQRTFSEAASPAAILAMIEENRALRAALEGVVSVLGAETLDRDAVVPSYNQALKALKEPSHG